MEHINKEISRLKSRQPNELPQSTRLRLDNTYQMIMDQNLNHSIDNKGAFTKMKMVKKLGLTAAATFVLGGAVIGSGFVSPAMAAALGNLPLIGSVFKTAEEDLGTAVDKGLVTFPNVSVTHDGITLKVVEAYYDGNRLSVGMVREGAELDGVMMPWRDLEQSEKVKGYIDWRSSLLDVTVNGKLVKGLYGDSGEIPGQQDTFTYNIRKGLEEAALPDRFELSLVVKVTQVEEPFVLKIPITKVQPILSVNPEKTMSKDDFSYTVKRVSLTAGSTRVVIDSNGTVPVTENQTGEYAASKMYYDIVDEQGNPIQQSWVPSPSEAPKNHYHEDELYSAFSTAPKSITIKPYTYTLKKSDWTAVDKQTKTYHKDLEMTIPLNP